MGKVVLRYLDDVDDPVVKALRALLLELLGDASRITSEGHAPNDLSGFFFLLGAAWVRSRAERPSVS